MVLCKNILCTIVRAVIASKNSYIKLLFVDEFQPPPSLLLVKQNE